MKQIKNYGFLAAPVALVIAFFASSLCAEAFLGRTRGEVKERLGEPEGKDEETNGVKYMVDNYAYIIRYDASGTVDRCMITKLDPPLAFTPQEFNDLTKSFASEGFKNLKSDGDTFLMVNHETDNAYYAQRSGAGKDWICMTTYKAGGTPDLTFFKAVMRKLSGDK